MISSAGSPMPVKMALIGPLFSNSTCHAMVRNRKFIRSPVCGLLYVIRSAEILSINKRVAAILLTTEITAESEGIVRLVLVCRGLHA